jgi:hypothetical protein
MEVSGQLHAPATLLPGKEPQSQSGHGGEEKNFQHSLLIFVPKKHLRLFQVFWVVAPCRVAVSYQRFGGIFCTAMHFLQRSTHFSKTYCRPLITSKFLASELLFHGWKSPEIARGSSELNSVFDLEKVDRWNPIRTSAIQSRCRPRAISGLFQI